MKRLPIGLLLVIVLAWAGPARAQLLFPKKQKPNPTQRVPELIVIVKTDSDERKRTRAAEELRDYDAVVFAEIVPVLADVLLHDKKVNVRAEALTSLTKIRPVSALAGKAIEKAAADDDSLRVRMQAKAALPKYHLAGYSSKSPSAPPGKAQTEEPPLAFPTAPPAPKVVAAPAPLPSAVVPALPKVIAPPPREAESVPSDPPIPRPFPPLATPPAKTPPPAQGPSLFP